MSRLNFAPKPKEIEIADIQAGIGVFSPKPDKAVSFAALKTALKQAGYTLASAEITIVGRLARDDSGWWIVAEPSGQRFVLVGSSVDQILADAAPSSRIEITGDWKTVGEGSNSREVIAPHPRKKSQTIRLGELGVSGRLLYSRRLKVDHNLTSPIINPTQHSETRSLQSTARLKPELSTEHMDLASEELISGGAAPLTPIRTTSPGLTVYRGGAIIPRYFYTSQRLGNLKVARHTIRLNLSYTPTPTLQLEAELPYSRTFFEDGLTSGSSEGFGNITLWGKYRLFRTLETWGDRQAAVRFGVEMPTGKVTAPSEQRLSAPAFVRQQLTPINSGFATHLDAAYSRAKGRFVFGGNVEGILRSEREGSRLGHELRINTDLEYVLFPLKYHSPTNELFVILEATFVYRGSGRVGGGRAPESWSTEFLLAPALQYVPNPRLVIETSVQFPLARNLGSQVLRTERNILVGIRYLF